MPPEAADPRDPREWLRRARSNLARARIGKQAEEIVYADLCFDAQQAAEKALKGLLVRRNVSFPKTHDLMLLFTLLRQHGIDVSDDLLEADALTEYAVDARYPGLVEEATEEDHLRAVELAQRVVRWVESHLDRNPPRP